MELIPTQMLQAVPHLTLGIFNLAIPNAVVWLALIIVFFVAAWARIPKIFEPTPKLPVGVKHEFDQ